MPDIEQRLRSLGGSLPHSRETNLFGSKKLASVKRRSKRKTRPVTPNAKQSAAVPPSPRRTKSDNAAKQQRQRQRKKSG